MIITIKNLQQQTFLVDVNPDKTVAELKEQIYNERGEEYPVEKQNLIYAGVILDDEKTIASYNIRSNKFLVVMIKRDLGLAPAQPDEGGVLKKTEKQISTSGIGDASKGGGSGDGDNNPSTSDAAAKADNTKNVAANKETKNIDKDESAVSTSRAAAAAAAAVTTKTNEDGNKTNKDNEGGGGGGGGNIVEPLSSSSSTTTRSVESVLLMGDDYNRMVNSLMEMGYSREIVERALQASFNNPERAVEYLICGIPSEAADAGLNAAEAAVAAEVAEVGDVLVPEVPDADAEASEDPLEFLRSQPQFVQMRALIQQNPDLLNAVLQQIGLTNPALLQLITENQESFLNMLNEPIEGPNPLDPAFFVSLADRRRRAGHEAAAAAGAAVGVANNDDSSANENNAFQNCNSEEESNNRSGDDGNVHMDDRIPEVSASDVSAAVGAGDRLRARAAGFAAALGQPNGAGIEAATGRVRNDHGRTANRNAGVGSDGASGGLSTIRLTPQDQAAIERLTALGFPEALVVQAYFACEKNETLAANFLLNTGLDD